jgi:ABC-type lipopolysaccharide export system ATPase subunit
MNTDQFNLKEMKTTIDQIEKLVHKLKDSGAGVPVVEKNARIILSVVNILKFGISDPAEILD